MSSSATSNESDDVKHGFVVGVTKQESPAAGPRVVKKRPIWKLVQLCAEELTKRGNTPFTRGDLVRCVQRTKPDCGPNSINPIIQGVTDNLRGGAPGAVGKDVLHSVGRGRFVLSSPSESRRSDDRDTATKPNDSRTTPPVVAEKAGGTFLPIGAYEFRFVCDIDVARDEDGTIREDSPQERYENHAGIPLNRYGRGPFCKFTIPRYVNGAGVYALVAGDEVQYVGECQNLAARFNNGYGKISPRNCFVRGPETTCRINNLVLEHAKRGMAISLWFFPTDEHKLIEAELRAARSYGWNRA